MKHLAYITLTFCLFFTGNISAQDYNSLPTVIQQKMDDNKMNGIDVLSGIETHFSVEVLNLSSDEFTLLTSHFENDTRVKSMTLQNNGATINVIADGSYTIKDVKTHVMTTAASIENYTVNYEISQ